MGCCGNNMGTKKQIEKVIKENTQDFEKANSLEEFRDRYDKDALKYGICRNLIKKDNLIFCPLHPALIDTDLRIDHCDINHLCKTFKLFQKWNKEKQNKFLNFLKTKKENNELDWYTYSIGMDQDTLLEEFRNLSD